MYISVGTNSAGVLTLFLHRVNLPTETAINGYYANFDGNVIGGVSNIDATNAIYNK